MHAGVERSADYYLEHALHLQGERYEPRYRLHRPVHYYYDLLAGLDCLTALGYGHDRRMAFALDLLRSKRRPDGRWILDAVQPDYDAESAAWFAEHPENRPSKMITLRALVVLSRIE
jgi:hypothetical protein